MLLRVLSLLARTVLLAELVREVWRAAENVGFVVAVSEPVSGFPEGFPECRK